MKDVEKIIRIAEKQNGIVSAGDVTAENIPRRVLTKMVNENLLQKAERGLYLLPDVWEDEWLLTQYRYSKGVYSHGTALYLHGYSDRTPLSLEMTFPRGYHKKKANGISIVESYAINKIYELGIITMDSPAGHPIRVYNLEKSICDIVRARGNYDVEIINSAMKRYTKDRNKNLYRLMDYAKLLRIEDKIRNYIEVLL